MKGLQPMKYLHDIRKEMQKSDDFFEKQKKMKLQSQQTNKYTSIYYFFFKKKIPLNPFSILRLKVVLCFPLDVSARNAKHLSVMCGASILVGTRSITLTMILSKATSLRLSLIWSIVVAPGTYVCPL